MEWKQPSTSAHCGEDLLAVPVTTLYDHGTTVEPSQVLQPRLAEPAVTISPGTAERLGLQDTEQVAVTLAGMLIETTLRVQEGVPDGIVLVPRSQGLPLAGPETTDVRPAVVEAA